MKFIGGKQEFKSGDSFALAELWQCLSGWAVAELLLGPKKIFLPLAGVVQ